MAKFTEKQIISKLQELRQIKPSNDWVVFTKEQIFEDVRNRALHTTSNFSFISFIKEIQKGERFTRLNPAKREFRQRRNYLTGLIFRHKPAFAFALSVLILIGVFGFAQNSVPGDSLFPLKRIAEKGTAVFVSEKDQAKHSFELANKRLDDLTKIAEENEVKNLAPAINEYQKSVSKAAESLVQAELGQEIINQVKKLEESKQILIEVYGIAGLEEEEQANPTKIVVEWLIEDSENSSLTEEKQEILAEVKEDYEAGDYFQALEKILLLINNNN